MNKETVEYLLKTIRENSDEVEIVGLKFVVTPKTFFETIEKIIATQSDSKDKQ